MQTNRENDVKSLNSFLRGELAAVETYEQCIDKLRDEPATQRRLRDLQASHQHRADMLVDQIRSLGGDPADSSGVWGGFAKLIEGSAKAFGKDAAIAALEEGEDHGRDDYKRDLKDLSPELQQFVQSQLLPEQLRTHNEMSAIKRQHRN
jgi:uncharacterized protein (TIGR02284 family)